jgi:phospholipid/cholesterol/gamma-HCH transport system permease protein
LAQGREEGDLSRAGTGGGERPFPVSAFALLGRSFLLLLATLGRFFLLGKNALGGVFGGGWKSRDLFEQLDRVGVQSILMVSVTSAFTGMVMAVQTLDQFVRFGATGYIGGVVALTMVREMSPVLTGLVVAGRVGAAMAAELGTMKVTEQLDALRAFGLDPVRFVVAPRLLACLGMLPLLTVYSVTVGIGGGAAYVAAHGVPFALFRRSMELMLEGTDLTGGLVKGLVFGGLIAIAACSEGLETRGGAEGVGRATTGAVVWSDMLILIFNYILSALFFGGRG